MAKKTPGNIFNKKQALIDTSLTSVGKQYSAAERWLYREIIESVLPELDVENGVILNTNKNINTLTARLNVVFTTLRTGRNREIVNNILSDLGGVGKFNAEFFGITGDVVDSKFKAVATRVDAIMQKALGFNPDKTVIPNSFIDTVGTTDAVNNKVRELAIRNIQGGGNVRDFTAQLGDSILTNDKGLGVLQKHYKQVVDDRYAQFDRAQATAFADELGMQAFIYSGGKVDDTRKFCCQRNGLVFTRDEAQKWTSMNWQGKNVGYSPLIDMGGYNCRHSPQWISTREALRRRPDLEVNKEGKLVPKKGAGKQKLNSCS